jgi:hypothetical protein
MPCLPMFLCGRSSVRTEGETAELRRATEVVQELSDRYRRASDVVDAARSLAAAAQSPAEGGFVRLPAAGITTLSAALAAFDAAGTK